MMLSGLEVHLVDVGNVKAYALGVWGIIEHERVDGFIH